MQPKHLYTLGECEQIRTYLMQVRDKYVPNWKTQARFIDPKRFIDDPTSRDVAAILRARDVLDNTAGYAKRTFIAGMMNGSTSRARPWWTLAALEEEVDNAVTQKYIARNVNQLNQLFQLSNLYRILPTSYGDLGIFSNSAFSMMPHKRWGFYFKNIPLGSYAFATDSEGMANTFVYDFTLTVRELVEEYGKLNGSGHVDWSKFDPWVQEAYTKGEYYTIVQLSMLVIPNPTPVPNSLMPQFALNYQIYCWVRGTGIQMNGNFKNNFRYSNQNPYKEDRKAQKGDYTDFVEIAGSEYFPFIVNRWEVGADGIWGVNGPGEMSIQEVQVLQEQEKFHLEGIEKIVRPAMIGPTSLRRAQSSILPGSMTYVDEMSDGTKYRKAYDVDPSLVELVASKQEYRERIRKAWFEDLFLMMAGDEKISHVTAREIEERASEKMVGIGPALGQQDQDQNGPLIRNGFLLGSKIPGKFPPVPEQLKNVDFRPEYISILAQAAKASMIAGDDRLLDYVNNLAIVTANPMLTKMLKGPEMIRQRADYIGSNPAMLLDEEEYAGIVQAANEAAAQQAQIQNMNTSSQTAKNLSQAEVGKGSMLDVMQQQQERL